ncbi:hypothetical protein [Lactococcus lactis]|uniref:hypothetical protein n=1 Tax=Lactococcus lactis TaxID=1358 RepID=UPI00050C54C8|nr:MULTISPECIES: hypothetical protein [Lactococcus]ARE01993.1 prophage protein [Lactococcus lactis subsp. lactis]ARE04349.1 prophage protein [Lactococcus lactis subsp. lactis]ARE11658.1 hypothetical protein LLUC063_1849 [Lactococcus lactis subsp. lactis]KSU29144.1 hypothetical protein ML8_1092 [Lactococcus lactis subsp. lactis]KSU31830.1 hypothetical protein UC317_1985 [Lactococcus lactis subsp. lactis]
MSVLENKSKIINSFNLLVRANPGTELVVLTQGGIVLGKVPSDEDFQNNSALKNYVEAIKAIKKDDDDKDDELPELLGLVDVTVVNGISRIHLSFTVIFVDQILGVSIGSPEIPQQN